MFEAEREQKKPPQLRRHNVVQYGDCYCYLVAWGTFDFAVLGLIFW